MNEVELLSVVANRLLLSVVPLIGLIVFMAACLRPSLGDMPVAAAVCCAGASAAALPDAAAATRVTLVADTLVP
jgi:hypothetical protein